MASSKDRQRVETAQNLEAWRNLAASLGAEVEEVPAEFLDSRQLRSIWGLCNSATREKIYKGVKRGLIERKEFRIKVGGQIRMMPHYRIVKK